MKKRLLASVFSVCIFMVPVFVSAQTAEISAALQRLDALIAEMNVLRSEFASLAVQAGVTTPKPAVQGAVSGGVLGDDLAYGSTNDAIARVQRLLATDADIYEYGADTGFFGPKTQAAVRLFQLRFGLDTVGVIGPSTRALLETFMAAYPDEDYPADVLKKAVPTVAGAQTSTPPTSPTTASAVLKSLTVEEDAGEYIVRSYKTNGTRNRDLILYPDDYDELVEMIADRLGTNEDEIRGLLDEDDVDVATDTRDDEYTKRDAEDAIDDADEAIDEARDAINEADDDGEDIDDADEYYDDARDEYRKAKDALDDDDYENAFKNAEDAIELAERAIDALDGSSANNSDIESIKVRMYDGRAKVRVEYEDGDDEKFTVDDDDADDVVAEIADELDIDEDDVLDLVEFNYGDLQRVYAERGSSQTRVRVTFESGLEVKMLLDEEDEDDIIEAVADELDLDEDDVERVFEADF